MASYDRQSEIKAFDNTKAGVKGLVDSGVTEIPRFFHHPAETMERPDPTSPARPSIPVIDLGDTVNWESVVELVREASETFGFFQVLNHGVPQAVLDEMLQGVRRFNEQDLELKMRYYTRDQSRSVIFNSNFDLYESPVANWRDTLLCRMAPEPAAKPEELPEACKDIIMEYTSHIQRLGHLLFELLSEGLGLDAQYLNELECGKGLTHLSHYYPPCPEPQLAIGTSKHSDPDFLTILLQDDIGGLQVLHQNQWIDVAPIPGAFVINIGDLLQERAVRNATNAKKQICPHTMGRISSVRRQKETSVRDRLQLWKINRIHKDGSWSSEDAELRWAQACELLAEEGLTPEDGNVEANERIFKKVMGPEHSGRVRTQGLGVTPNRYFPHSTPTEGSSSGGFTRIAKLEEDFSTFRSEMREFMHRFEMNTLRSGNSQTGGNEDSNEG